MVIGTLFLQSTPHFRGILSVNVLVAIFIISCQLLFLQGCISRKIYASKRETAAAISIQKYTRMCLMRHAYVKLGYCAIIVQSNVRGFTTRQRFLHRKEHKAATYVQVFYKRGGVVT